MAMIYLARSSTTASAKFFISCISIVLLACSGKHPVGTNFIAEIENKGPVALKVNDPYAPANLLVSYQAEKSKIVAGFIEHNNVPPVIELNSGWFKDPEIIYYYPVQREFYSVSKHQGDWTLVGPKRMSNEHLQAIDKLELVDAPIALQYKLAQSEQETVARKNAVSEQDIELEQRVFDSNSTGAVVKQAANPQAEKVDRIVQSLNTGSIKTNGSPEMASVSARGDLTHVVKLPYENLKLLALWYSYETNNEQRLKRINQVSAEGKLSPEQAIIIPAYLVRNKLQLTPSAMQLLINEFSKEELGISTN